MVVHTGNIMIKSDSYKGSHFPQYPKGTEKVVSYLEARGSILDKYGKPLYNETVMAGLTYICKRHLVGQLVTKELIDEAEKFWNAHFGFTKGTFNREGWEYIMNEHDGYLPIKIKAVPEGTVVPLKNALAVIENNDPENTYWLTNFLETLIMQVWYPITVATNSREIKKKILRSLYKTGNPELIDFKLHDFGFRGVSSYETSAIGGFAHLINFMGTDTTSAIILAMNYYNADMCGFSVPASEHSTMTSHGRENEEAAYRQMLETYPDAPIVSIVSDSYDIYNAVENIFGKNMKEMILAREGKTVVRPDSGDPVTVLCGKPSLEGIENPTREEKGILRLLWENFPGHVNEKGYKVLDPHIGVLQGDGISIETVQDILDAIEEIGFSADNIVFGSGGGLLQKFDRDTLKFAIKCCYIVVNGKGRKVFKDPITSKGKKSKAGLLKLVKIGVNMEPYYVTISNDSDDYEDAHDEMIPIYENGKMLVEPTLEEIRERAKITEEELFHVAKVS